MTRPILLLLLLLFATPVFGSGPLRVYVGEFNAVGVAARDETRVMLQSLLASRLNSDRLLTVSTAGEAEVVVGGTYVAIGKQYNIDAFAKTIAGQTVTRSFVQGEGGQEALFGAVSSLAEKLGNDLTTKSQAGVIPRLAVAVPDLQPRSQGTDVVRTLPAQSSDLQHASQSDIIRQQPVHQGAPNRGEIKRLEGMYNLLAVGEADASGRRRLFMAENRSVTTMREGDAQPVTAFSVKPNQKVVSLDYVDADGNGTAELYVTVMTSGEVESQIWEVQNNRLVKSVDNIPYFFRAIAMAGGPVKLYAQEQGRGADQFFGDVYEVSRQGTKIIKKQKIVMPRYGNLYRFNQFKQQGGELLTVVYHEDNYLIVYDKDQKELWRSNDAFGGSELYYLVKDLDNVRITGNDHRWVFMNQRIQVTAQNEVLVGKNDGLWVIGDARSYKKGAVYCLAWNGSSLEEKWRTRDTQNYMPDYWFDEARRELLILQTVQRADAFAKGRGASSLSIKKVE